MSPELYQIIIQASIGWLGAGDFYAGHYELAGLELTLFLTCALAYFTTMKYIRSQSEIERILLANDFNMEKNVPYEDYQEKNIRKLQIHLRVIFGVAIIGWYVFRLLLLIGRLSE